MADVWRWGSGVTRQYAGRRNVGVVVAEGGGALPWISNSHAHQIRPHDAGMTPYEDSSRGDSTRNAPEEKSKKRTLSWPQWQEVCIVPLQHFYAMGSPHLTCLPVYEASL